MGRSQNQPRRFCMDQGRFLNGVIAPQQKGDGLGQLVGGGNDPVGKAFPAEGPVTAQPDEGPQ